MEMRNISLVEMRIEKSSLHQIRSELRWAGLCSAWAAALLLGFLGFEKYTLEAGEAWSPVGSMYLTLQLIVLNSGGLSGRMNSMLETFHPYERAALMLVLDCLQILEEAPGHILVAGLGRLGQQVVLQAGYSLYVQNRPGRLCVTVLDREADSITTDLQQEYPQLPKVCELRPIQVELKAGKRLQHVLRNLDENVTIGAAFVCLGDPMLIFQMGLGLLQTPAVSGQLWYRVSSDVGHVDLLQNPLPGMGDPRRIRSFDIFEQTCSAWLVLGGLHEMLARGLYEIYRADSENESTRQTWAGLPETLKEANRQQANRIHHLLEAVGYRLLPLQDWDAGKRIFSKTEIEKWLAWNMHYGARQKKKKDGTSASKG
jgi:hypothetical protein